MRAVELYWRKNSVIQCYQMHSSMCPQKIPIHEFIYKPITVKEVPYVDNC
jgi:hypothetical protein